MKNKVAPLTLEVCQANLTQINNSVDKAIKEYNQNVVIENFNFLKEEINLMRTPMDRRVNDMKKENDVLARQNTQFIKLYRQCLVDWKKETDKKVVSVSCTKDKSRGRYQKV